MGDRRASSASLKEQNANSLLHSSIVKGNKSTLLEAIKLGCNLKSLSKYGDPPIVSAAGVDPYSTHDRKTGKDKMLDILDVLLSREECDVNIRGAGGETALHRAMSVRAQNRVKYLLEQGCDADIRDSKGQTALFNAMAFAEGLEILLRYQPLLDVFDSEGFTPLMVSMMSESPQSLQTLKSIIEAGADVNRLCAQDKKSALMVTLREDGSIPRSDQRVDKSLILLVNGIQVNSKDNKGKTALHYAVKSECVTLVQTLLKNKASVDIKDSTGKTVVDVAIETGNSDVIRLIERAADKSSRLLPYEEALSHLEDLYSAVTVDHDLAVDRQGYIKSQINKLEKTLQEVISAGRSADFMSVQHKRILMSHHNELCEEMMPLYIVPYLHKENVISKQDVDTITSTQARKQMCIKLLEILPHRGSKAFPALLQALKASKQDRVCQILNEHATND